MSVRDLPPSAPARPWWFRRAMYGLVVLLALGAVLVWLSTGGVIAIVATVMAVVTAIPAISLARREAREPEKLD